MKGHQYNINSYIYIYIYIYIKKKKIKKKKKSTHSEIDLANSYFVWGRGRIDMEA